MIEIIMISELILGQLKLAGTFLDGIRVNQSLMDQIMKIAKR